MNQKASLYHYIIPGFILAIGLFAYMTFDLPVPATKGVWHMSVIRASIAAEGDLVLIEQAARDAIKTVTREGNDHFFTQDHGCGLHDGLSVIASSCRRSASDDFLQKLTEKLSVNSVPYILTYEDGYVIGTAQKNKIIASSASYIPTEKRSAGLFETYDAALIRPFLFRYEYNPSFRIAASNPTLNIAEKLDYAQAIISSCHSSFDLEACISANSPYTFCEADVVNNKRLVTICQGDTKIVILDLTPISPPSITDFTITTQSDYDEIRFPVVSFVNHYTLHHTNAVRLERKLEQNRDPAVLFDDISPAFDEFHRSITLEPQPCSAEKLPEIAYDCSGIIIFYFPKTPTTPNSMITITSTFNNKESLVDHFETLEAASPVAEIPS